MTEQPEQPQQPQQSLPPRKDGLADERDDPQTHPYDEEAAENAETSLDQPSDDVS